MNTETTYLQRRFLVWAFFRFEQGRDPTRQTMHPSDAEAAKVARRMSGSLASTSFRAFPTSWPRWVRTVAKHVPDNAWTEDGKRWSLNVIRDDVAWLRENGVPSLNQVLPCREHYVQAAQEWTEHLRGEMSVMGACPAEGTKIDMCVDFVREGLNTLAAVLPHEPDPDGPPESDAA